MPEAGIEEGMYGGAHLLFCLGNCLDRKRCSVHDLIRLFQEGSESHGYQALAILEVQALPSLLVSSFAKDTSACTGTPWQSRNGRLPDPLPHTSASLPYRSHGCSCAQHRGRTAILVTFWDSFKAAFPPSDRPHCACAPIVSSLLSQSVIACGIAGNYPVSARCIGITCPAWQIHQLPGNHQIDPRSQNV